MFMDFLKKLFISGWDQPEKPSVRIAYGVFSGYMGIVVNILLFALKITVGILAGSVAIAADAINNLSDAGSSVVIVLGFKLAAKPADREHPFGHGRIELCCAVVVSVIIMMIGLDFFKESIFRIITPGEVTMTPVLFWLLAGSLLFKVWLFFFYRHMGKTINSSAIMASAFDSLSDICGTAIVLLAVFLARYTTLPIDGCAGVLVAVMVFVGGGKILLDAISPLLGEIPRAELVAELQERLLKCEGIKGVHDIIVHSYGPNQYFATAHAEIELKGDLLSAHDMLEKAEVEIGKNMPVNLLLHCDPYNPDDDEGKVWRVRLEDIVCTFDQQFKVYDFRMKKSEEKTVLTCHILIPRNYLLPYDVIQRKFADELGKYSPVPELQIEFIHPFV